MNPMCCEVPTPDGSVGIAKSNSMDATGMVFVLREEGVQDRRCFNDTSCACSRVPHFVGLGEYKCFETKPL